MSLSAWFRKANKEATHVADVEGGPRYYTFELLFKYVEKEIKKKQTLAEQREYIAKQDPTTGKNAFHYLFSHGLLFSIPENPKGDFVFIGEGSFEFYDEDGDLEIAEISSNSHQEFKRDEKLVRLKNVRWNQGSSLINSALAPFDNDEDNDENNDKNNEALTNALLAKDKRDNTALFYVYKCWDTKKKSYEAFENRLARLNPQQKARLFDEKNPNDETIWHLMALNCSPENAVFDENRVKNGLLLKDADSNTLLHNALKNKGPEFVEEWVELISRLAQVGLQEEKDSHKALYLDNLFCQNRQHSNPLHLLLQRDLPDDALPLLQKMLDILTLPASKNADEEKKDDVVSVPLTLSPLVKKLIEQDEYGCTPLHYAIKTRNGVLVEEILKRLNNAEKKLVIKVADKSGKTALRYAGEYGDYGVVQKKIVEALGPLEVYQARQSKECTIKCAKEANILFGCF